MSIEAYLLNTLNPCGFLLSNFSSQISILSYYTFIPIFFLDVPIYHSINSFTQISLSKSCEKQSVEDPTTKESFKFKTRILDPEMNSGERKKKKKNSSKQLNGSVTALSVKSKVQSRVSLRPNSSTNLSASKPDRNLVAGQRAVWQLAINSLLSPASSINRARQ